MQCKVLREGIDIEIELAQRWTYISGTTPSSSHDELEGASDWLVVPGPGIRKKCLKWRRRNHIY